VYLFKFNEKINNDRRTIPMNKENETLLTRTLLMINGLLAMTYVVISVWVAVELFHMIF
jgi:hypothetical protein